MVVVPICACPIPEVGRVHVGGASPWSVQLPVHGSTTAPLNKSPALMAANVSTAAGSVMAMWTVQTSQTSRTVSLDI